MKTIRKLHPSKIDQELAHVLLNQLLSTKAPFSQNALEVEGKKLKFNENILGMFIALLDKISKGEEVSISPKKSTYSTQEAADILNVSRPFLVKQLESGVIPFHRVGAHRRIAAKDLKAYRKKLDKQKKDAFEELAKLGQEIENA